MVGVSEKLGVGEFVDVGVRVSFGEGAGGGVGLTTVVLLGVGVSAASANADGRFRKVKPDRKKANPTSNILRVESRKFAAGFISFPQ
jgi:hypothetical protein